MSSTSPTRVDVHQHFVPEYYRDALERAGITRPDGMAGIPRWSANEALATMDRLGVATGFLSISSPGVYFAGAELARPLARRANEDAAGLAAAHPGRFGFFAVTPLPDIDAALEEITHAFDELGADGVVFETNFGGVYLGDAMLAPVYAELNRRKAILFIHPTSPHCSCSTRTPLGNQPADIALGYPRPMLEFMFETTRTVTHMLLSGVFERYRDIHVIVPHAGACLPVLAGRIELLRDAGGDQAEIHGPHDIRAALGRLHFDMAGAPVPELLGTLLQIADGSKLHYGSDWPFTPTETCARLLQGLIETPLFGKEQREAVMSENSKRLFRRLSTRE